MVEIYKGIEIIIKKKYNHHNGPVKYHFEAEHTREATQKEIETAKRNSPESVEEMGGHPIEWFHKPIQFEISFYDYDEGLSKIKKAIDEYFKMYPPTDS